MILYKQFTTNYKKLMKTFLTGLNYFLTVKAHRKVYLLLNFLNIKTCPKERAEHDTMYIT